MASALISLNSVLEASSTRTMLAPPSARRPSEWLYDTSASTSSTFAAYTSSLACPTWLLTTTTWPDLRRRTWHAALARALVVQSARVARVPQRAGGGWAGASERNKRGGRCGGGLT